MNLHRSALAPQAQKMRTFDTFKQFSDADLDRIARAGHHTSVPAGWALIHEQTPSDACYVILDGEVDVYYGREHVARLQAGDIVGEAVVHQGKLRSATVTSVGAVELLHYERDEFSQLMDEIPALRTHIVDVASRHTTTS